MDEQKTERYFAIDRLAESQVVLDSVRKYKELGYQETKDEVAVKSYSAAWQEVAKRYQLGEFPKIPTISVLKKEGKTYLFLEFSPNLSIIIEPAIINRNVNYMRIIGNEIQHVLVSKDGQSLDLMSVVRPSGKHHTVLSFFGNGFCAPNEHQQKPIVVVPIGPDFVHLFLHEKSHEVLSDRHYSHIGLGLTAAQKEREVNANATQVIRQLNARFPQQFVDPNEFMVWAEHQLKEGYDQEKDYPLGLDYLASSRVRKRKRQDDAIYDHDS